MDADSDNKDCLGEDEDAYGCFVLGLSCPILAMFLMSRVDRAAPQSMKAKVAPFHNFILECGGALKLCGERRDGKGILSESHHGHIGAERAMQIRI